MLLFVTLDYLIVIIANIVLGLLVIKQNIRNVTNISFFALALGLASWITTLYFFYSLNDAPSVLFFGRLNFVFALLLSHALFVFAYHFPIAVFNYNRTIKIGLVIFTSLLCILTQFTSLIDANEIIQGAARITVFGPLYPIFISYLVSLCFMALFFLLYKLRRVRGIALDQLKYVLLGIGSTFLIILVTNVISPFYFGNYYLQEIGPSATLFFIIFSSYAIIRHRMFNIRLAIRTFVLKFLTALFISGFLFLVYKVYDYANPETTDISIFLYIVFASTVIIFIFQNLSHQIAKIIDLTFFRDLIRREHKLNTFTKKLNSTLDANEVVHLVQETMREIGKNSFVHFVHKKITDTQAASYTSWLDSKSKKSIADSDLEPLFAYTSNHEGSVVLDELNLLIDRASSTDPEMNQIIEIMTKNRIAAVVPFSHQNSNLGLFILGFRQQKSPLNQNDIQTLEMLAFRSVFSIQNAILFSETKHFNDELAIRVSEATSDLHSAYQKLEKSYEDLKQLDKLKDEFVSITSHDLRTPLTIMRTHLWRVIYQCAETIKSTDTLHLIKTSYESVERMIKLVNNTLTISQIDAGHYKLRPEIQDLAPLAKAAVADFEQLAASKSVKMFFKAPPPPVPFFAFDKDRIREVMTNLLTNALNYTPPGGSVTLTLTYEKSTAHIAVSDTGKGIPTEDREKLFKKFGRLEHELSVYSSAATGIGLGLYICKTLVELHQGTIWVESTPEVGSTFHFTLPVNTQGV